MIRLITDTSANLPVSLIQKYNITVLSFHLTVDGVPFPYNYKTDFDGKAYYDKMRGGARVQTSMINQSDYGDAFTDAVANGDDVLYVGMSGGISGAARIAQIAANEVLADYPDRQIEVIDTYAASLGEGFQVLSAAEMLASGMSLSEAADKLRADRAHMCQYFTVDDLAYLQRGGRISGAAALVGTVLQIKPVLVGDETGHIVVSDKVRGRKQSLTYLADKYDALTLDKSAELGIAHGDCMDGVEFLLGKLRDRGFTGEPMVVMYEPVTGGHVGPGTVALFFRGTHK